MQPPALPGENGGCPICGSHATPGPAGGWIVRRAFALDARGDPSCGAVKCADDSFLRRCPPAVLHLAARRRVRFESGGAVCKSRARVCAQGVSEQDLAQSEQRSGCGAAAGADAGVLWMLRLAFVRAWTLAAGAAGADVSGVSV